MYPEKYGRVSACDRIAARECPTTADDYLGAGLFAYCPVERVAAAVGQPIQTGHPGFVFTPITYWPGRLGPVTDPDQAREWPELVLLSAPGHVQDESRRPVLEMVLRALETFGPERGLISHDYISARLPEAARIELEAIMSISVENYQWESEFARRHQAIGRAEGKAEGRAAGEASAILTVLAARGIEVDGAARERILTCADLERLSDWLSRWPRSPSCSISRSVGSLLRIWPWSPTSKTTSLPLKSPSPSGIRRPGDADRVGYRAPQRAMVHPIWHDGGWTR